MAHWRRCGGSLNVVAPGRDVVAHWRRCGGSLNVVAPGKRCGGSLEEMWWLLGRDVVAH